MLISWRVCLSHFLPVQKMDRVVFSLASTCKGGAQDLKRWDHCHVERNRGGFCVLLRWGFVE